MAYNFLRCDRDQPFLLPPDLRDWLPEGHLAWFVLDVVDQLDLTPFYRAHRDDGHGHPAYDPQLLLGVLLYGYCLGVRSSRQLERRCVEDIAFRVLAAEADQREDRLFGEARGDELPGALASKTSRLAQLRQAKARLEAEAAERARRFAERSAASAAAAAAKGKPPPTLKPRARDEAPNPTATANVTDPDSRLLHTRRGRVQGYNAQAVTTCEQVIVAGELTQDVNDFQQLEPMLQATTATLAAARIAERPGTLAADSGYWSIANLTQIPNAPQLLIPPPKHGRHGKPRKDGRRSASRSDGLRAAMTAKLTSEHGKARYAKRKETVEPVFGQIKDGRGARRFLRRGLAACAAEWKLLCGTHNLLKLWRHTVMRPAATSATA